MPFDWMTSRHYMLQLMFYILPLSLPEGNAANTLNRPGSYAYCQCCSQFFYVVKNVCWKYGRFMGKYLNEGTVGEKGWSTEEFWLWATTMWQNKQWVVQKSSEENAAGILSVKQQQGSEGHWIFYNFHFKFASSVFVNLFVRRNSREWQTCPINRSYF